MSLAWATSMLTLALFAEPIAGEPVKADPSTASARGRVPFVQVGIGGAMVRTGHQGSVRRAGGPTFELEGGALLQPRPRLRLGLGGSFAQTGYEPTLATGNTDLMAKLRLGLGHARVWGYGIAGLGFSLVTEDGTDFNAFQAGGAALAGLGVRGRVGERISLGLEVASAITWIPPRDTIVRVSGVLVLELRFGG
jgi:hypothetical protein